MTAKAFALQRIHQLSATPGRAMRDRLRMKHPSKLQGKPRMISAKQLLGEIVNSLRNVIAPAIDDPYPKAQAYMAAVILDFVSRQVKERGDIEQGKAS